MRVEPKIGRVSHALYHKPDSQNRQLMKAVGMSSTGANIDVSELRSRSSIFPIVLNSAPLSIMGPMHGVSIYFG